MQEIDAQLLSAEGVTHAGGVEELPVGVQIAVGGPLGIAEQRQANAQLDKGAEVGAGGLELVVQHRRGAGGPHRVELGMRVADAELGAALQHADIVVPPLPRQLPAQRQPVIVDRARAARPRHRPDRAADKVDRLRWQHRATEQQPQQHRRRSSHHRTLLAS
jgi:hypothetical protein